MDYFGSPFPTHFDVPRPAHFRIRPDLIDELCIPDAMRATLPYLDKHYGRWIARFGLDPNENPASDIILPAGRPYRVTRRYVLCTAVLPGQISKSNLVIDSVSRTVECEKGGLFQFVFLRALQFAIAQDMEGKVAFGKLLVPGQDKPVASRIDAPWAIGYDTVTGYCTLLIAEHASSIRLYLEGNGGYYIPWPEI
ncbi:hypothetical protein GALL_372880 [mine drainage metagenome]|uniref:Uncharacterized protein n=1 Tax=mine drainage metagenome TaxID=410659 RepID=A0A1J5QTY2_9ZZZZ